MAISGKRCRFSDNAGCSAFAAFILVVAPMGAARAQDNLPTTGELSQTNDVPNKPTTDESRGYADLFTGRATYSIPIELPPGSRGVQPQVSLTYRSDASPGHAGVGWRLGLEAIRRSFKHGTLAAGVEHGLAIYELDGKELVSQIVDSGPNPSGCSGSTVRYVRKPSRFQQIYYCTAGDYFAVASPNGTVEKYGTQASSKHVNGKGEVVAYYLDETSEPHGLSWRAVYYPYGDCNQDGVPEAGASCGVLPRRYEYTFHSGEPLGALRKVEFSWVGRSDGQPESADFLSNTIAKRQLASIQTYVGTTLVRTWAFAYTLSPQTKRRLLSQVIVSSGPAPSTTLQTYGFSYNSNDMPGFYDDPVFESDVYGVYGPMEQVLYRNDQLGVEFHDAFGVRTLLNLVHVSELPFGEIDANGPLDLSPDEAALAGFLTSDRARDLVDIDGDGTKDLVLVSWDASSGHYRWSMRKGWGAATFDESPQIIPGIQDIYMHRRVTILSGPVGLHQTHNVLYDMVDMDGDRLLDVYTRSGVYFNRGGAFEYLAWDPGPLFVSEQFVCFIDKVCTRSMLIDFDGDGCADRLRAWSSSPPEWTFEHNRMCDDAPQGAFAEEEKIDFGSLTPPIYLATTSNIKASQVVDISGDGLPDFVWDQRLIEDGILRVLINSGDGFLDESSVGSSYAEDLLAITGGMVGSTYSMPNTGADVITSELVDINADGRPDIVNKSEWAEEQSPLLVYFNTGFGFIQDPIEINAPSYLEMGDWLSFATSVDWGQDTTQPKYQIGALAMLTRTEVGAAPDFMALFYELIDEAPFFFVYRNLMTTAPDLLVEARNGLGTAVEYDYANVGVAAMDNAPDPPVPTRQDVVDVVRVRDRTDAASGSSGPLAAPVVTSLAFDYFDPYHDPVDGFRGFGRVRVQASDTTETADLARTTHYFYVGSGEEICDPDSDLCTTDTEEFAGSTYATYHSLNASILNPTFQVSKEFLAEEASEVFPMTGTGVVVRDRVEYDRPELATARRLHRFTYDRFGNRLTHLDAGRFAGFEGDFDYDADDGDLLTTTSYCEPEITTSYFIANRPCTREVSTVDNPSQVLRELRFYYDELPTGGVEQGDLTTIEEDVISNLGPPVTHVTAFTYDDYGNRLATIDAGDAVEVLTYQEPEHIHVASRSTTITVGKPVGSPTVLTSTTLWDDVLAQPTDTIDPAGRWQYVTYDVHGRPVDTYSCPPTGDCEGRPDATVLLSHIDYFNEAVPGGLPYEVRRRVEALDYFDTGPTDHKRTITWIDGTGNPVQVDATGEAGAWIRTTTQYGMRGAVRSTLPRVVPATARTAFWIEVGTGALYTESTFDKVGRVVASALLTTSGRMYDKVTEYLPWQVTTYSNYAETTGRIVHHVDGFGRLERVIEREGQTQRTEIVLGYDALGNQSSATQDGRVLTTSTYDNRGLLEIEHDTDRSACTAPAVCDWTYEYDPRGRLTTKTDARGYSTHFEVDEADRVVSQWHTSACSPTCPLPDGSEPVDRIFDGPAGAAGKLVSETKGDIVREYEYDRWGRTTLERLTIGSLAQPLVTEYEYDLADRLELIIYPTSCGGVRERAVYSYDAIGLRAVGWESTCEVGSRTLVADIEYEDPFLRTTRVQWGGASVVTRWTYHPAKQKVSTMLVEYGLEQLGRLGYGYRADGRLVELQQSPGPDGGPIEYWAFTYDYGLRLTSASAIDGDLQPAFDAVYEYDPMGNVTLVQTEPGPDYSARNARVLQPQFSPTGAAHRATAIEWAPDAASPTESFDLDYDDAGALVGVGDGYLTYTYGADGRMSSVTQAACTAGFADCDGVAFNGCEHDLAATCGNCDSECPVGMTCVAGECEGES